MVLNPSEVFFNPITYAETFLRILNKDKQLVPLRYNKAQRYFLQHRTDRSIVLKARQLGLSTCLQGELFRYATTGTTTTLTLTHLDDTTQAFRRMSDRFYDNLPEGFRPLRKYANASVTTYSDFGSEAIIATAGSRNSTRGITANKLHLSEVAFWPHAEEVMVSVLQAVPRGGSITVESTANGMGGWFADEVFKILDGRSTFKLFFFEWWWDDEYRMTLEPGEFIEYTDEEIALVKKHNLTQGQIKWRRFKKKELGDSFAQEYPESIIGAFRASGSSVFGDFTHALYDPPEDDQWQESHVYLGAIDWGQSDDASVLSILDITDNREVFLGTWRHMPWADIRRNMLDACEKWHVVELYPERNSASSNIENLESDVQTRGLKIDLVGFNMTNDRKSSMVGQLYNSIHEGDLKLLNIEWANAQMRTFISKQTPNGAWTYAASGDNHDDGVIARIAVQWAANRRI